jgi:hypothetical protein
MLDAYRDELIKNGQLKDAMLLKGLEVFTIHGAECALATVQRVPEIPDNRDLKRYVMMAIERAISDCYQQRKAS